MVTQAGMTTMTADALSGGDWTSREVVAPVGPAVELGYETEAQQGSHREPGTARLLRGEPGCHAPERFQIPRRPALCGEQSPQGQLRGQRSPSGHRAGSRTAGRAQSHGRSRPLWPTGPSPGPRLPHPQLAFQSPVPEPGPRERKHAFATISGCGEKPGARTCAHTPVHTRSHQHWRALCTQTRCA